MPSVTRSLRGKHVSSWFCSPVACWCSIYLALAPALSIWTQHTLIHSLMGNVGCVECFHRAPQRPCLAEQEGNKGSRFTAWHEGMGTVFGPRARVCGGTLRHTMSWAPLPPRSHRPVFHLVPPRTWWFGFPMPWQAARGLHPQAQDWLGHKGALLVEHRAEAPAGSRGVWPRPVLAGNHWQPRVPEGALRARAASIRI